MTKVYTGPTRPFLYDFGALYGIGGLYGSLFSSAIGVGTNTGPSRLWAPCGERFTRTCSAKSEIDMKL